MFFAFKKVRQKKLTKKIQKKTKLYNYNNYTFDYSLVNVLLRCGFFLFPKDANIFIKAKFVYINGICVKNISHIIVVGDCVQLQIFDIIYIYMVIFKKFLKYKIISFKQNSWLFFKKFFLKKTVKKFKKRKKPKFIQLLYLYKSNVPSCMDVDFITLSIIFLKKLTITKNNTYFLNKNFSWKLFQLYNFKKIN